MKLKKVLKLRVLLKKANFKIFHVGVRGALALRYVPQSSRYTDNLLSGGRLACPAVKSTRGGAPGSPVSLPFYLLIDFLPFLFVELHVS